MSNPQQAGKVARIQFQNDVQELKDRVSFLEGRNEVLTGDLASAMERLEQQETAQGGYTRNTGGRNTDQTVSIKKRRTVAIAIQ